MKEIDRYIKNGIEWVVYQYPNGQQITTNVCPFLDKI